MRALSKGCTTAASERYWEKVSLRELAKIYAKPEPTTLSKTVGTKAVMAALGIKRSALGSRIKSGTFPPPLKVLNLGPRSVRMMWPTSLIYRVMAGEIPLPLSPEEWADELRASLGRR